MTLNVNDAIKTRRATRKYTDQEITDEVLDRVVNLALEAPSAFNAQRADLVVVRDQAVKDAIFAASGQAQHRDAPVVLVTIARTGKPTDRAAYADEKFFGVLDAAGLRETAMKDAMLVSGFALLAAQNEGLGTSPTTPLNEAGVLKAVGLEGSTDHGVAMVISLGYPAEHPAHPGRQANRRVNDTY